MPAKSRAYTRCPEPPERAWSLVETGKGTRFRAAGVMDTEAADATWQTGRRPTDTQGWLWTRVLRETDDCLYALGSSTFPIGALVGVHRRQLMLGGMPARRLNYFQVAPGLYGTGFARQAFAAIARLVLDAGDTSIESRKPSRRSSMIEIVEKMAENITVSTSEPE